LAQKEKERVVEAPNRVAFVLKEGMQTTEVALAAVETERTAPLDFHYACFASWAISMAFRQHPD
jgi:hypothetical protein